VAYPILVKCVSRKSKPAFAISNTLLMVLKPSRPLIL
jgi:hypothetical protein